VSGARDRAHRPAREEGSESRPWAPVPEHAPSFGAPTCLRGLIVRRSCADRALCRPLPRIPHAHYCLFPRHLARQPLAFPLAGAAEYRRMARQWTTVRGGPMRARFAALALIAVVARALVPMGFMPVVVHGQTQLMFCDNGMPGSAHHGHDGHSGSAPGADAPCPFTISGGAAPLPTTIDFAPTGAAPRATAAAVAHTALPEAPPRHTAPRGPPSLA